MSGEHTPNTADICASAVFVLSWIDAGKPMTDRSNRLFEIIQILRSANGPVPAHALARSLEVTKRTIYRDIVALQATGVPIEGAAGIGYVMRAGYNLPPLMFTADEIEAIVVGLSLLGRTGDAGLQISAARVSRKISDVLPDCSESPFDAPPLLVSHWNTIPPPGTDYRMIRKAIREEEKLHLHYQDAEARTSDRTIRPIGLIYYVDNVLLAAWCELREDYRHFRTDRILGCMPTGDFFKGQGVRLRADWRAHHELFSPL
jgi:predicted DNA-binding transcriptional regulator YafY